MLSLVSAVSSAFFGWLLDRVAFPLNYQIVFSISFVLAWLDPYFFSKIVVPPLERPQLSASRNLARRFGEYFKPVVQSRTFLRFLAATTLYRVALNMPAPLFSLFWVNDLQAPDTLIGLRGTVGNMALMLGYLFWGRSAGRMGHRRVLTLAACGYALYPVLTALSPSPEWLLPVAAVWGLTVSGLDVGLFDLMLSSCPEKRQPLYISVQQMTANGAIFAGPLIGAALSNVTSTGTALIIAGIAQVVTTIPFVLLPKDV
jgi:MFS family permease